MSGQDEFGTFNLVGTVNDEEDVTVAKKTYIDSTLVLDMTIDGVPTDSNMFFAGFTFAANTGKEGNGQMVYASVKQAQSSFDAKQTRKKNKDKKKKSKNQKNKPPPKTPRFFF